jgi:methionyl-tRNA synthetase
MIIGQADAEGKTEIYHFIGKDIVYFHAYFGQPCSMVRV